MDIREKTALELGQLIKERKASSPELTRAFLDAAKEDFGKPEGGPGGNGGPGGDGGTGGDSGMGGDSGKLNAYTEVLEESAMNAAAAVQARIDKGENLSPLAGVPIAIKDNICTTEGRTTAASKILAGFRSPFDADAAEKLKEAGAVILGKTNMDEFAMGSSTENSCYGPVRNPWNLSRVPGGSSGGSAAAVAAGLAPCALGSDTGGSVRQPCGFTGLTGIKPTYGSVSRHGLVAYASSLDQIGPMALDARDASVMLSIISGPDGRDSTMSIEEPFMPCGILHDDAGDGRLDGIAIGLPESYFGLPALDGSIKANVLAAVETLRGLGAEVRDIDLPLLDYGVPAYLAIACAEAASNLARYDGVKYGFRAENAATIEEVYAKTRGEGFGDEAKRRILFGYFVLSSENFETYFRQAQRVRGMIKRAYDKALKGCDFILTPVSPSTPYEIGTRISDPLEMYIGDIYTASLNLTGLPGAAAPCGFDQDGMPTGMQLVGKAFSDITILDVIARYQRVTDFHRKRPPLFFAKGGDR